MNSWKGIQTGKYLKQGCPNIQQPCEPGPRGDSPLPGVQTPPAQHGTELGSKRRPETPQDATDATRRFKTLTETLPRLFRDAPRRPKTPLDANFTAKMVPKTDPETSQKPS